MTTAGLIDNKLRVIINKPVVVAPASKSRRAISLAIEPFLLGFESETYQKFEFENCTLYICSDRIHGLFSIIQSQSPVWFGRSGIEADPQYSLLNLIFQLVF